MATALAIILFLALSGTIAYIGDLLGRRLGKKRLSLFGLRPKHTAIVLTIVTGVFIAAATFLAAMLTVPGFRRAVMESERLARQNRSLALETITRRNENSRLTGENERLNASNQQLSSQNQSLASQNRALQASNDALQKERTTLVARNTELTGQNSRLLGANQGLVAANRRLQAERDALSRDTESLRQDEYIFRRNDVIRARIIPPNPPAEVLRDVIGDLVYDVRVEARDKGAREYGARPLTYLAPLASQAGATPTDEAVKDAFLRSAAQIRGRPVALVALADRNCVRGRPVPVRLAAYANEIVFRKGEEIARRGVDGTATEGFIMGQIIQLLQGEVRARAVAAPRRMIPTERGLGEMTYDAMLELCRRVRATNGPAVVVARARQDTMRVGRLGVEFDVERAGSP